jgi:hypothetical protein
LKNIVEVHQELHQSSSSSNPNQPNLPPKFINRSLRFNMIKWYSRKLSEILHHRVVNSAKDHVIACNLSANSLQSVTNSSTITRTRASQRRRRFEAETEPVKKKKKGTDLFSVCSHLPEASRTDLVKFPSPYRSPNSTR